MNPTLRLKTVKLLSRLIKPWVDEGVITVAESQEIVSNLKHLAEQRTLLPPIIPRLIDQQEAADMLGLSLSNFKKLEREAAFPFRRKMVGSSVRYRNTDLVSYIMVQDMLTAE